MNAGLAAIGISSMHQLLRDKWTLIDALVILLRNRDEQTIRWLMQYESPLCAPQRLFFHVVATARNDEHCLAWFIDTFKFNVNSLDDCDSAFASGRGVLWCCDLPKARVALARGANVNHVSNTGYTVARQCADYGMIEQIDLYLKHGARIEDVIQGMDGWKSADVTQEAIITIAQMKTVIEHHVMVRETNCRAVIIAMLGALRRLRVFRDVRTLLARSVWRTRRRSDWK